MWKRIWGWDLPGLGGGVSGPNPQKSEKSLEKVPGPSGPKSLKKVSGRVRKVLKKSKTGFSRLFGLSPRLFSEVWGPRVRGLFRDFFQTFGDSARRLLLPGRGDQKSGGIHLPSHCESECEKSFQIFICKRFRVDGSPHLFLHFLTFRFFCVCLGGKRSVCVRERLWLPDFAL